MPAPTIYRSTDTNAPNLTGSVGSLLALLDACLVNGYGSVKATATITSNGTTVANNDTVTIDGITYTWKTTLTPAANEVLIGANAAANLSNLAAAIGRAGAEGTNYGGTNTLQQTQCQVTGLSTTVLTLTALKGGSAANSIALSKSAANITVTSTFSGGSGTDTKVSLGWTKPYTAVNAAVFKQPAGCGFYYHMQDSGFGGLLGMARDALVTAFETMTGYGYATGTGQFPTQAQTATNGTAIRKSAQPVAVIWTQMPWILIGDDRTFYMFIQTGDVTSTYIAFGFGDFYSYINADPYKCHLQGFTSSQVAARTTDPFGTLAYGAASGLSLPYSFLARNYAGVGGSTCFIQVGDMALVPNTATSNLNAVGSLAFPNPSDGGLYLCPLRIFDGGTPGTTMAGNMNLRGKRRGLYHCVHSAGLFADGDTFAGTGAYAGRTFMVIKPLLGNTSASMMVVETTAWDISA